MDFQLKFAIAIHEISFGQFAQLNQFATSVKFGFGREFGVFGGKVLIETEVVTIKEGEM